MSVRIYRFPDLKPAGVPFHRVHVDRLEKRGQFPRRFSYGANSVAWVAEEVDQWVQGRIASRDAPAVPLVPEPNAGHLSESETETEPDVSMEELKGLLPRVIAMGDRVHALRVFFDQQRLRGEEPLSPRPARRKPPGRGRPVGSKDRRPRQRRPSPGDGAQAE
jgi:prophage regulatory protein